MTFKPGMTADAELQSTRYFAVQCRTDELGYEIVRQGEIYVGHRLHSVVHLSDRLSICIWERLPPVILE
jgi:hypothetical protein